VTDPASNPSELGMAPTNPSCREILASLVKHSCYFVLNNNTHVKGIWSFTPQRVGAEWLPKMKKAQVSEFAWTYSPSKLSQVAT